jgi:DNA-binding GntR family transcriptional regulator
MRSPRDIRVPVLTLPEFLEIRAIRIALEELAITAAVNNADDDSVAGLRRLSDDVATAIEAGERRTAVEANQAFHSRLLSLSAMPNLQRITHRLWLQTGPMIGATAADATHTQAVEHHRDIVEAMARRDKAAAVAALRADIMDGSGPIIAGIARAEASG